jgi:glycosyltransferase involved in cell wall biosynthesis
LKKLLIFTNHTLPASTGGCEVVVDAVASRFSKRGYEVMVCGCDVGSQSEFNGYAISSVKKESISDLLKGYSEDDCVLVYSDSFFHWNEVLLNLKDSKCRLVVCSVGFFGSNGKGHIVELIKSFGDRCAIICHSDSHPECSIIKSYGLRYSVIPNGVSEYEFASGWKMRDDSPWQIITIANCYPGKGHPQVISALLDLHRRGRHDFVWTLCCTTPSWPIAKRLTDQICGAIQKFPFKAKVIRDQPRASVIDALKSSHLMMHGSVSEVAPLVILESMAAGVPWVSFDVGNVSSLAGGVVCGPPPSAIAPDGKILADAADNLLSNRIVASKLSDEGVALIHDKFSWEKIVLEYESACFPNAS